MRSAGSTARGITLSRPDGSGSPPGAVGVAGARLVPASAALRVVLCSPELMIAIEGAARDARKGIAGAGKPPSTRSSWGARNSLRQRFFAGVAQVGESRFEACRDAARPCGCRTVLLDVGCARLPDRCELGEPRLARLGEILEVLFHARPKVALSPFDARAPRADVGRANPYRQSLLRAHLLRRHARRRHQDSRGNEKNGPLHETVPPC